MITKHAFVSLLDACELLPFAPKEVHNLQGRMSEHQRQREELTRFIVVLQRRFGEKIYHLGSEIIEGKTYQEFMFHGSGFLEVSQLAPVVINAHFHDKMRARKFQAALKSSIRHIVQPSRELELLLKSIDVKDEHEPGIQFQTWGAISKVRGLMQRSVSFALISGFIFAVFEAGEEITGEIFGKFFGFEHGMSKLYNLVIVAVIIAFCVKSVEGHVEKFLSKYVFK